MLGREPTGTQRGRDPCRSRTGESPELQERHKIKGTAQVVQQGILSSVWLIGLAHMLRLLLIPGCWARRTFSTLGLLWLGDKTTGAVVSPTKLSIFQQWSLVEDEETVRAGQEAGIPLLNTHGYILLRFSDSEVLLSLLTWPCLLLCLVCPPVSSSQVT